MQYHKLGWCELDQLCAILRDTVLKEHYGIPSDFQEGLFRQYALPHKKGEAISTRTLDEMRYALDCQVQNILQYVKE